MIAATVVLLAVMAQAATPTAPGAKVFAQTCSVGYCHGTDGAANRGPRLRGRTFAAGYVSGIVHNGIANTAMPAFAGKLKDDDLNAVISWVESIATITEKSSAPDAGAAVPLRRVPAEFAKGHDLFFDATRGTRCGTCHQVDGRGTNAGPDLTLQKATRNPALKLVRQIVLSSGETFPALPAGDDGGTLQFFDLTSPPPVLRTFPRVQVRSMDAAAKWSHADAVAGYSDADLAAITQYLSWLGPTK